MKVEIILDYITKDSCSIKEQKYILIDGIKHKVGDPIRRGYMNCVEDRLKLESEYLDYYNLLVSSVWGNNPTVNKEQEI